MLSQHVKSVPECKLFLSLLNFVLPYIIYLQLILSHEIPDNIEAWYRAYNAADSRIRALGGPTVRCRCQKILGGCGRLQMLRQESQTR
jgi:hypothetical protein